MDDVVLDPVTVALTTATSSLDLSVSIDWLDCTIFVTANILVDKLVHLFLIALV